MILIGVPVLWRWEAVPDLVAEIAATTPEPHLTVLAVSPGDEPMGDVCRALAKSCRDVETFTMADLHGRGDWARKLNTIWARYGADASGILCAAQDVRPHPGWAAELLDVVERTGAGVVGTNDLGSDRVIKGIHATHPFLSARYLAEFGGPADGPPGVVAPEAYFHEYADDEICQVAQWRGEWAAAPLSIVEHLHPDHGKRAPDRIFDERPARMRRSREVFRVRRRLWS